MHPAWWEADAEPWADDVAEAVVRIELRGSGWSGTRGSGFVVGSNPAERTAWVVTAYHVVSQPTINEFESGIQEQGGTLTSPTAIWVIADTGSVQEYRAEVVAYDSELDIALLSACCPRSSHVLRTIKWARELSDTWFPAFSIGFGKLGERARVVSGKAIGEHSGTEMRFDAGAVSGDSGSPVFDSKTGMVVGMLLGSIVSSGERKGQGIGVSAEIITKVLLEPR